MLRIKSTAPGSIARSEHVPRVPRYADHPNKHQRQPHVHPRKLADSLGGQPIRAAVQSANLREFHEEASADSNSQGSQAIGGTRHNERAREENFGGCGRARDAEAQLRYFVDREVIYRGEGRWSF